MYLFTFCLEKSQSRSTSNAIASQLNKQNCTILSRVCSECLIVKSCICSKCVWDVWFIHKCGHLWCVSSCSRY